MGLFDAIRRLFATPADAPAPPVASPPAAVEPAGSPPAAVAPTEPPPFPYPLTTVHGSAALATWRNLRATGDGWPVVIGTDEDLTFLREGIEEIDGRSPEAILATAAALTFPASLAEKRAEDEAQSRAWLREQGIDDDEEEEYEVPVGDWPTEASGTTFGIAHDVLTGRPHDRVHIAVLPCATGWEAIAHLRWGGWNENPAAEYHVAALRSWSDRFGAELVGCSHDVIELHVASRPATRESALALAREQYLYCADIVDQGTETLAGLAAVLMAGDWWYFWWD